MSCQSSKNGKAVYRLIRRSLQALSKGHCAVANRPTVAGRRDSAHTPPPDKKLPLDTSWKKGPPTGDVDGDYAIS
jgi:hypothetical protein